MIKNTLIIQIKVSQGKYCEVAGRISWNRWRIYLWFAYMSEIFQEFLGYDYLFLTNYYTRSSYEVSKNSIMNWRFLDFFLYSTLPRETVNILCPLRQDHDERSISDGGSPDQPREGALSRVGTWFRETPWRRTICFIVATAAFNQTGATSGTRKERTNWETTRWALELIWSE